MRHSDSNKQEHSDPIVQCTQQIIMFATGEPKEILSSYRMLVPVQFILCGFRSISSRLEVWFRSMLCATCIHCSETTCCWDESNLFLPGSHSFKTLT